MSWLLHSSYAHAHVDFATHTVALLGSQKLKDSDGQRVPAIVRIERTPLPSFSSDLISTTKLIDSTDIVRSLLCVPVDASPH